MYGGPSDTSCAQVATVRSETPQRAVRPWERGAPLMRRCHGRGRDYPGRRLLSRRLGSNAHAPPDSRPDRIATASAPPNAGRQPGPPHQAGGVRATISRTEHHQRWTGATLIGRAVRLQAARRSGCVPPVGRRRGRSTRSTLAPAAAGVWVGGSAEKLGLAGEMSPDALGAVLAGLRPEPAGGLRTESSRRRPVSS